MHALAEWLARAEPDPLGIQYTALLKACTELCNLKGIAAEKLYVWLECMLLPHSTIALVPSSHARRSRAFVVLRLQLFEHSASEQLAQAARHQLTRRPLSVVQILHHPCAGWDPRRHAQDLQRGIVQPSRLVYAPKRGTPASLYKKAAWK